MDYDLCACSATSWFVAESGVGSYRRVYQFLKTQAAAYCLLHASCLLQRWMVFSGGRTQETRVQQTVLWREDGWIADFLLSFVLHLCYRVCLTQSSATPMSIYPPYRAKHWYIIIVTYLTVLQTVAI